MNDLNTLDFVFNTKRRPILSRWETSFTLNRNLKSYSKFTKSDDSLQSYDWKINLYVRTVKLSKTRTCSYILYNFGGTKHFGGGQDTLQRFSDGNFCARKKKIVFLVFRIQICFVPTAIFASAGKNIKTEGRRNFFEVYRHIFPREGMVNSPLINTPESKLLYFSLEWADFSLGKHQVLDAALGKVPGMRTRGVRRGKWRRCWLVADWRTARGVEPTPPGNPAMHPEPASHPHLITIAARHWHGVHRWSTAVPSVNPLQPAAGKREARVARNSPIPGSPFK